MSRHAVSAVAVALLLAGCGSGASPTSTASPVIARVAARGIDQAQFDIRFQSALTSIRQAGGPAVNAAMTTDIRASVLRSLILDTVIAEEAATLGIEATAAQVQAQVSSEAQAAGGTSALEAELADAGGSITQLEDEIRASLNEQRLEDHFAKERAAEIEQQLAAGTSFPTVAQQFSDDTGTSTKGGDLGTIAVDQLGTYDPKFAAAVRTLAVGAYTTAPVHDAGGYDIVMVYAATPASRSVRHVLVAAPTPYTVTDRPAWFSEALFSTVAQLCQQNEIHVYLSNAGANPCSTATPSPAAATPGPTPTG